MWNSAKDQRNRRDLRNVGTAAEGAVGNSDVSLAVAPDGALYFVTMGPHTRDGPAAKNTIAVGVTRMSA